MTTTVLIQPHPWKTMWQVIPLVSLQSWRMPPGLWLRGLILIPTPFLNLRVHLSQ